MKKSIHTNRFEDVYILNYERIKRFAIEYVMSEADAENITQDVFMQLWENQIILSTHTNIIAFLFTSTKNRCLDFLRHKAIVRKTVDKLKTDNYLEHRMKMQSLEALDDKIFSESNIESIIQNAIEMLPEKCREIFIMNKIEGKKQKAIAEDLNISINTVENQMSIAHKKLRLALKDNILFYFL